jgi:uroporphyrin-3 C-methyltransferase
VQPSGTTVASEGADRDAALAALQLELTMARAAIERRDERGYRMALARVDGWLRRLGPDSPDAAPPARATAATPGLAAGLAPAGARQHAPAAAGHARRTLNAATTPRLQPPS